MNWIADGIAESFFRGALIGVLIVAAVALIVGLFAGWLIWG